MSETKEVTCEVIGEPTDIVVVLEKTGYWHGVVLYTHQGSISLDADEVTSLIERLTEARQKILK